MNSSERTESKRAVFIGGGGAAAGVWALTVALVLAGCATEPERPTPAASVASTAPQAAQELRLSKWAVFEQSFSSTRVYATNAYAVKVLVRFTSGGGREMAIPARYLGGHVWKVQFVPNEVGRWTWKSECSDASNPGLHGVEGTFFCAAPNQISNLIAPPLDDANVRTAYILGLFNNPASDIVEVGNLISPSAKGMVTPLFETFSRLEFWRLRSCPELIVQPDGGRDPGRQIAALKTGNDDLLLAYTPGDRSVSVLLQAVPKNCKARWLDPRTGSSHAAIGVVSASRIEFPTPEPGDWFLELSAGK
jgi:hypothetical protein